MTVIAIPSLLDELLSNARDIPKWMLDKMVEGRRMQSAQCWASGRIPGQPCWGDMHISQDSPGVYFYWCDGHGHEQDHRQYNPQPSHLSEYPEQRFRDGVARFDDGELEFEGPIVGTFYKWVVVMAHDIESDTGIQYQFRTKAAIDAFIRELIEARYKVFGVPDYDTRMNYTFLPLQKQA